jgi:PAS domain S-box-containing protein
VSHSEQSRETMRASEIRYRRLFEAARDGILILDAGTRRITEANPFIAELLGYSRNELIGKELWEIGLLRDQATSQAAVQELQRNGYIRYDDLPLATKAGQRRDVEFVSNLYQENGHQVIQCNIRDITERKQTAEALHASTERFRILSECTGEKIFTAQPNGEVDYFNQPWMEFTGLALEDLRGWSWTRLIHPDDVAELVRQWQQAVDTGEPFEREYRLQGADGVYRWQLSRAHVLRDAQGHLQMWIGSTTDIDDLKRAEEKRAALLAREQAARELAEAAVRLRDEFLATVTHDLKNPLTAIKTAFQNPRAWRGA